MAGASFQINFVQNGQSGQAGQDSEPTPAGSPQPAGAAGPAQTAPQPSVPPPIAPQAAPAFAEASQLVAAINDLPDKLADVLIPVILHAKQPDDNPDARSTARNASRRVAPANDDSHMDTADHAALMGYQASQVAREAGWPKLAEAIGRTTMVLHNLYRLVEAIKILQAARAVHQAHQAKAANVQNSAANPGTSTQPAGSSAKKAMQGIGKQLAGDEEGGAVAQAGAVARGAAMLGETFEALSLAVGPVIAGLALLAAPIVALAVVAVVVYKAFSMLVEWVNKMRDAARQWTQDLAQYNATIAMAAANAEVATINQKINRADQLQGGLEEFNKQDTEMLIRMDRIATQIDKISLSILNPILNVVNKIAAPLDAVLTTIETLTIEGIIEQWMLEFDARLATMDLNLDRRNAALTEIGTKMMNLQLRLMWEKVLNGPQPIDVAIDQFLNPLGPDGKPLANDRNNPKLRRGMRQ